MGIGGVEYHGHTWEWGARKVKELLFTGRAMSAKEAESIGMVTRVVQSVFEIHQTGHGHAISESGLSILMQLDDMKGEVSKQ